MSKWAGECPDTNETKHMSDDKKPSVLLTYCVSNFEFAQTQLRKNVQTV